jgi:CTP:molybdopterin cytidylyltransferase MocA
MVIGVILAAGSASRMGELKQVLPDESGVPLVVRAFDVAVQAGCLRVVVVTGASAERVRGAFGDVSARTTEEHEAIVFAHNPEHADGMGGSLVVGIEKARAMGADAAIVMLADQPLVSPSDLSKLLEGVGNGDVSVAAALYDGVIGVPACFAASCFDALLDRAKTTPGRGGARALLRSGALGQVLEVPMAHAAFDLDTPEDLERYRAHHHTREA